MRVLRIFWSILALTFLFSIPAQGQEAPQRGMFVSVIQNPTVLSSRQAIEELISFSKKQNVQTLFVQVYRENKAWFASDVADDSPYEACFKSLSEDPLAFLIRRAHAHGIEVHAWVNLMSLGSNAKAPLLIKYGPEILTRNLEKKKSIEDYRIDNQYFLEPGDLRVREELRTLVGEVVGAYPDLDGIQFDYIRYPDWHPFYGYTRINVERFKKAFKVIKVDDKDPRWAQWKRDQVTMLLKELIAKARSTHPGIQVSTTGLVPYSRAHLEAYQDWRAWLQGGLVDFITLMCYTHEDTARYRRCIDDAKRQIGNLEKVNIAVGSYRLLASPEVFEEQWDICEDSGSRACVVFHYGDMVTHPAMASALAVGRKNGSKVRREPTK